MSLKSRIKAFIAQTITAPIVGRMVRLVYRDAIPFHGLPIASCSTSVSPRVSAQLFWGIYESAERRFVEKCLAPDMPVIELGSSIGGVSSHIARRLAAGQRLVCVEANPHLLPILEKNLAVNAGHLQTSVVHAAASTEAGTVSFAISASSLSSQVGSRADAVETVSAPARKLSDLLTNHAMTGQPFQLVMDIEGAEAGIVFEDASALGSCHRIVAELHETRFGDAAIGIEGLIEAFVARNFRVAQRYGPVVVFERAGAAA